MKRTALGRPTILLLPSDQSAVSPDRVILEQSAFQVIVARNLKELEAACATLQFNVAVLAPALGNRMKQALALLLRQKCPDVTIIELFYEEPAVEDAIHVSGEPGPELIKAVNAAVSRHDNLLRRRICDAG